MKQKAVKGLALDFWNIENQHRFDRTTSVDWKHADQSGLSSASRAYLFLSNQQSIAGSWRDITPGEERCHARLGAASSTDTPVPLSLLPHNFTVPSPPSIYVHHRSLSFSLSTPRPLTFPPSSTSYSSILLCLNDYPSFSIAIFLFYSGLDPSKLPPSLSFLDLSQPASTWCSTLILIRKHRIPSTALKAILPPKTGQRSLKPHQSRVEGSLTCLGRTHLCLIQFYAYPSVTKQFCYLFQTASIIHLGLPKFIKRAIQAYCC